MFQIKSCLSTSAFVFFTIFQILERKFYVFWSQTCKNFKSMQFANFLIVCLHWGVIPIPAQLRKNVVGQKLAKYDMKFVDWKSNLFRINDARHEYRAVEFEYTTYAVFTIQRLQF